MNKKTILEMILKQENKPLHISEIKEKYNTYIYNLDDNELQPITNEASLEGMLYRSSKIIFGIHKSFRYFDYDSLTFENINKLRNILELEDGSYTTELLYNKNNNLMQELNIKDEYELHNILKSHFSIEGVTFSRMPDFRINCNDKLEFVKNLIAQSPRVHIDEFVDYVHKNYGHKPSTFKALILMSFEKSYLQENLDMFTSADDGRRNRTKRVFNSKKNDKYSSPFNTEEKEKITKVLLQSFKNGYRINSHIDFEKFKMIHENFLYTEEELNDYLQHYYAIYNEKVIILSEEEIEQFKKIVTSIKTDILSYAILFKDNVDILYDLRIYNVELLKSVIQNYFPNYKYRDTYSLVNDNLSLREILNSAMIEFANNHIGEELTRDIILNGVAKILGISFDEIKKHSIGPNNYRHNLEDVSKDQLQYYNSFPKLFYQIKKGTYGVIGQEENELAIYEYKNTDTENDSKEIHTLPVFDENIENFIAWIIIQKNQLGTCYLERVIRNQYVRALISAPYKLDVLLSEEDKDIFKIKNTEKFYKVREIFRNASNFKEINENGNFSASLNCYERYLKHLELKEGK